MKKLNKITYLLLTALCFIFVFVSCRPSAELPGEADPEIAIMDGGKEFQIEMKNSLFDPQTITIEPGTVVTWTNEDDLIHTVTSGSRNNETSLFDSGNMRKGETFSFTFSKKGTYDYFCRPHTGMEGVIEVQ